MTGTRTAAVLVAAGALALPGAAAGATFSAVKPCYVSASTPAPQSEPIALAGSGFTPSSRVDIDVGGARQVTGAPVDAAGNLAPLSLSSPFVRSGEQRFAITATEQGAAAPAAVVESRATALDASISRTDYTFQKARFRGRGFTGQGRVYAHYRFRDKTRKTISFRPKGPCGTFRGRRPQIPVKRPRNGEWVVQFDQQRTYSPSPRSVFVQIKIQVSRKVRF